MVSVKRERLPNRRQSETFDFKCGGLRYTCTVGRFRDGRIAEIFLGTRDAGNQSSSLGCPFSLRHRFHVVNTRTWKASRPSVSPPLLAS
jgi:hypothetical protein